MNRTDRLLAIVLELHAKRRRRAGDLAATFETSVRTIYRDIQALSEAGVPVVAVPGKGYSLLDGYCLPPVSHLEESFEPYARRLGFVHAPDGRSLHTAGRPGE